MDNQPILVNLLTVLLIWLAIGVLNMLIAYHSQIDAWCEQRPVLAGILKLVRGLGLDPWLMLQGIILLLKGRLPPYMTPPVATAEKPKDKPWFPPGGAAACVLILALPILHGCSGTFQQDMDKALLFEATAQTAQGQIYAVASNAILALPADQQAAARAKLDAANQDLVNAFNAKDDALQQAAAANSFANINLGQITSDVVQAVQAIIALVQTFGVSDHVTAPIQTRLLATQAKVLVK